MYVTGLNVVTSRFAVKSKATLFRNKTEHLALISLCRMHVKILKIYSRLFSFTLYESYYLNKFLLTYY